METIFQRYSLKENVGDRLAPLLTERLFGVKVEAVEDDHLPPHYDGRPILYALGSGVLRPLDWPQEIWGAGAEPGYLGKARPAGPGPMKRWRFHAVRGHVTRAICQLGADIPVGDPALLTPRIYQPGVAPSCAARYFLHCDNAEPPAVEAEVTTTRLDPFAAIDLIASSGFVFTEALHVAILAHAYGIPWAWALHQHLSGMVKWYDWFSTLGVACRPFAPQELREAQHWHEAVRRNFATLDTDRLLCAFPEKRFRASGREKIAPRAHEIPFASFKNHYAGQTCYVVGRGPTTFDYRELEQQDAPVFFVNDAVAMERHVRGDCFFFAHDPSQRAWLDGCLKSVPVLPDGGKLISGREDSILRELRRVVLYRYRPCEGERLLRMTREELAAAGGLYTCVGTLHALLHFVWFCGFSTVRFVGCDGINDRAALSILGDPKTGYDRRLPNRSATAPWWQYRRIREVQNRLCRHFGFTTEYLGTPKQHHPQDFLQPDAVIPRLAHFIWLGSELPAFAQEHIARFAALHPGWTVRLWREVPPEVPERLRLKIAESRHYATRSDLLRLWVLAEQGGIYLDTDMYVLRSFEELRRYDHFCGLEKHGRTVNNAVLGATPRCPVFAELLDRACTIAGAPFARTQFGPDLLTQLRRERPGLLNALPEHYFFILRVHASALRFREQTPARQAADLDALRPRMTDQVAPFAIHLWGIPAGAMPPGVGKSTCALACR